MANDFWNFMTAGTPALASGASGFLGGLFGDSGAPYEAAMDQYKKWAQQAQKYQQPFYEAGSNAIPQFQNWLNTMQDPSQFINTTMGGYQESPWAKYQQQQAMRAGLNAASMGGLPGGAGGAGLGSTPMTQFAEQQARNISSQDMNQWLQSVLGINTQYGAGQAGLMSQGANAANALTNMYGNMGQQMGEAAFGRKSGESQDFMNRLGGGLNLAAMFL